MNITTMREQLKEGLQIVERVVGKNTSLPVLQNVLLVAKKNTITFAATDLQIGITYEFLGSVEKGGSVVFGPNFLSPLLSAITEPQVSLKEEQQNLDVVAGSFHTVLHTVSAEDFPIIPSVDENNKAVEVESAAFCKGLAQVVGMVGQSQARPEIGGVFFAFEKELLRVVATDSFRLAEKKLVFEKQNATEHHFILPQRTVKEVISIFSERQGKIKIYNSPSQVVFDYARQEESFPAHIQIVSRVIDGEYPDYQNVIPKTHKTKVVFQKEECITHIKAASVFSGKTNEVVLSVDPTKKQISFTAKSADAGENHSFMGAEVEGEKTNAAFNWRFLLDGLLQLKDSRCELVLNGEDGAALLRAGDQEGYLYVIMPIKA